MPTARIPIDITWSGTTGSPGVNIWHARVDSVADPNPDVQSMADMLETFYGDIADLFPSTVVFHFAGEAAGVGDDNGDTFTADPWTVNGTNTVDFLPPANCVLVQWRTGTGGRHGRGRTFLGPLARSLAEANGTPEEASRGEIQAAVDTLVGSSEGFGNGALGVYSRTTDTFRDFQSGTVPNYFAVLRSRRD